VPDDLTPEETEIRDAAIAYARKQGKKIAKGLTDPAVYKPDPNPVSVFMAGSPGAGKTEASKALLEQVEDPEYPTVRIDPDELRGLFPEYAGDNSWLFQPAISILVDKVHDLVLKNRQNFLLDGTLAKLDKARDNIARSLKKGRFVQILYVYQEPALAWEFVCAREELEGRNIRPADFVDQYFAARQVVNTLKAEFAKKIQIDLILKNRDNSTKVYKDNIDKIDNHVPEKYTREQVGEIVEKASSKIVS
jgi:predicted ABC-type ATPase